MVFERSIKDLSSLAAISAKNDSYVDNHTGFRRTKFLLQ